MCLHTRPFPFRLFLCLLSCQKCLLRRFVLLSCSRVYVPRLIASVGVPQMLYGHGSQACGTLCLIFAGRSAWRLRSNFCDLFWSLVFHCLYPNIFAEMQLYTA